MKYAYWNCTNLTGSAVCGDLVTDFSCAYTNCKSLGGSVWAGKNVTNMYNTYYNTWCSKSGNIYILSPNVANATNAFYRYTGNYRINIYIPANSITYNTFISNVASTSIVGTALSWTTNSTGGYIYNSTRNIYLYPVEDVEATMDAHGWARS